MEVHAALLARWREILPESALNALMQPTGIRTTGIRLNPLRSDPGQTLDALNSAGFDLRVARHIPLAFTSTATARQLQEHPCHAAGAFHIQSLSSMVPALALGAQRGESVVDLCAAPGSKTSQIAAMMDNSGRLVAVDSSRARIFRLREVLRILGAQAECICAHGERWARGQPCAFDRVLVDAPCSGEGRIHLGDSAAADGWSLAKVRRLASLQKALLHAAIDAVRPGGTVVYSTCTFAPEENELVIQRALERYEGAVKCVELPVAIPDSVPALGAWRGCALDASIAAARRIVPPSEGFFIAKLVKSP